jgi:RNA polymerase sigma-70 factor (ECF subfamily)
MTSLPDGELAQRAAQAGDNECFAELFARHRKQVYYACRRFFSDSPAAEDATQETFLRAYRNIRGFHEGDFSGWLMRIAKNVCIDEWRRRRPETRCQFDTSTDALIQLKQSGVSAAVLKAIVSAK